MSHDAANVYGHQTFLQGTVSHGYRLFVYKVKNLLPEDCKSGMQSVYKIFEPTSRDLSAWVQHFYMVSKQMVGRVCSFFFLLFPNQHPGDCLLGCIMILQFPNLPPNRCICYVPVIFHFSLVGVLSSVDR